jgi:hypothetical protein
MLCILQSIYVFFCEVAFWVLFVMACVFYFLKPYALYLPPLTFFRLFHRASIHYKPQTINYKLSYGCAGLLPYFFLLKEKSNKKVQGETRTLRAFSPGQRLPLCNGACVYFVACCVMLLSLHACVRAADSCAVSSGPKLPFQVSLWAGCGGYSVYLCVTGCCSLSNFQIA